MSASDRQARLGSDVPPGTVFGNNSAPQRPASRLSGQSGSQLSSGSKTPEQVAEVLPPGNRPSSIGAQHRAAASTPIDAQQRADDIGLLVHASRSSRDAPLRTSVEARPVSRSSAAVVQSPYLQSPAGRNSQCQAIRPSSRPQSQQSPQAQHPQPSSAPIPPGSAGSNTPRSSGLSCTPPAAVNAAGGARLFQTYGSSAQRALQPVAAAVIAPHPKPPQQHPLSGGQGRPREQSSSRANTAQQQQQQAGPRATTALSGARSAQRGRHESGNGSLGAEAGTGPVTAQRPGGVAGTMGPAAVPYPHAYPHHHHPYSGHHGGSGYGGGVAGRDVEVYCTSFGYDDIPEEEDESASPPTTNAVSGLTLDQYMQRMVTTPASAAATSGLGVSADSEESAPCSPGNASTRTEEEDLLYTPPGSAAPPSPCGGCGEGGRQLLSSGSGRAAAAAAGAALIAHPAPSLLRLGSGSGSGTRGGGAGASPSNAAGSVGPHHPGARGPGSASRSSGAVVQQSCRVAGGRCTPIEEMFVSGTGGGGAGGSGCLLPDGGSSDDEQLSPSTLLDSPRSARRLSSRASAMAFSNSLDLRPATAAVVSSPSMARGDHHTPRSMAADSANHHAIIKQVDLGGLSASLFTPTPKSGREDSSPASNPATTLGGGGTDLLMISNPSSPDIPTVTASRGDRRAAAAAAAAAGPPPILRSGDPLPSPGGGGNPRSSPKTPMAAIPPPWGVSAREGAFGGGPAGDGSGGAASLQALAARPLSSRGRPAAAAAVGGGGDGGVGAAAVVGAGPGAGRPASGSKWAKPQPQKPDGGPPAGGLLEMQVPPEVLQMAAEAQGVARPPTRQVQSARPPGSRGEMELDPSVWQANIAMQLQRPPSRQKPPPEALHLWTPEQQMSMLAGGGLGRPGGSGRPLGGRPQSAAPTSYRTRPTSGPSVKAQGPVGEDVAGTAHRPPSRQKPPPLSTLLEHDDFPPPPPGSRRPRPGADQLDVVVSCSDDDDLDL